MAIRVANIGPKGRRQRVTLGVVMLGIGVIALCGLLWFEAERWLRVLLVVPFWVGALGVFQARGHT